MINISLLSSWRHTVQCGLRAQLSPWIIKQLVCTVVLIAILVAFSSVHAAREKRVALVIGNSKYVSAPLRNPAHDASDVAALLQEELGFTVQLVLDASQADMRRAIRNFSEKMNGTDVRLFYYAGHGVSVNGGNYMIPVGAEISTEDEVPWEAVNTSLVLEQMERTETGANVMILDACRDNPLPKSTRSGQGGLEKMQAPPGSLIFYATAPGQVALDGNGKNGTFTKHLLKSLAAPNVHIGDIALDVRVAVMQETGNKQVPWSESSLTRRIYLAGQQTVAADSFTAADTSPQVVPDQDYDASILLAYNDAARSGDSMAQARLGYIYDVGRTVPEDNSKARHWYEKAGDQGDLDAIVNLGVMYLSGDGISADSGHAFRLFSRAAAANHPVAQRELGSMYQFGGPVSVDLSLARIWFERAAAQGNINAYVDLGDLYSRGLGVTADNGVAFKWYEKAAKQGSPHAQAELGYLYDEGIGVDQSDESAFLWYQKAADQLHPIGMYNLGEMYELGKHVNADPARARALYEQARKLGDENASKALRRLLDNE